MDGQRLTNEILSPHSRYKAHPRRHLRKAVLTSQLVPQAAIATVGVGIDDAAVSDDYYGLPVRSVFGASGRAQRQEEDLEWDLVHTPPRTIIVLSCCSRALCAEGGRRGSGGKGPCHAMKGITMHACVSQQLCAKPRSS